MFKFLYSNILQPYGLIVNGIANVFAYLYEKIITDNFSKLSHKLKPFTGTALVAKRVGNELLLLVYRWETEL